MSINVIPYVGIDHIRLGMHRDEVRTVITTPPSTFLRNHFAESPTDFSELLSIQVEYNKSDICNYIGAESYADPILFDKHPTQMSFTQCTQWLLTLDPDLEIESDCVISRKLGVSTYTSLYPEGPVECIGVFERDTTTWNNECILKRNIQKYPAGEDRIEPIRH